MEDFVAGLWLTCQIDSRTLPLRSCCNFARSVGYTCAWPTRRSVRGILPEDPDSIQAIQAIQTPSSLSVLLAGAYPAECSQFGGFAINCIVFRPGHTRNECPFSEQDSAVTIAVYFLIFHSFAGQSNRVLLLSLPRPSTRCLIAGIRRVDTQDIESNIWLRSYNKVAPIERPRHLVGEKEKSEKRWPKHVLDKVLLWERPRSINVFYWSANP